MSNILVISEREDVIKIVNTICNGKEKSISSSEEAVSHLNKNKPSLVILDLEVTDLNIFVAHELLKVCKSTNNSTVIIVVSEKTKNEIEDYKKLIHPPDEFIKDSEIIIHLDEILKKYSILPGKVKVTTQKKAEDIITFTEELSEDIEELDIFDNALIEESETSQGIFIVEDANDHSGEIDLSLEDSSYINLNNIDIKKNKKQIIKNEQPEKRQTKETSKDQEKYEKKVSELNAEIVSMEKQNEFMKKENLDLLKEHNIIKKELEDNKKEFSNSQEILNDNQNEIEKLKVDVEDIIGKKDEEIERIRNNNKEDVDALNTEIEQSKSDKKILESSLMDEITLLKSDKTDLEKESKLGNTNLESLEKELTEVKKQLDLETKETKNLKKEIASIEKAKDEKEKILISSIDHLKKSITSEEEKSKEYKEKLNKITKLSKNLSDIIDEPKSK